MYKLLCVTQSKLRTYGNGNHHNYLGDDHLIYEGGGGGGVRGWQILSGQNIYFQFFAGQKLYFRLLQNILFISGYNNVESGGQARLLFYFLGHTLTQARLFIFKFLAARISISKNCHKREYDL